MKLFLTISRKVEPRLRNRSLRDARIPSPWRAGFKGTAWPSPGECTVPRLPSRESVDDLRHAMQQEPATMGASKEAQSSGWGRRMKTNARQSLLARCRVERDVFSPAKVALPFLHHLFRA